MCVDLSQLRKVASSGLGFGSAVGFERARDPCSCWCIGAQSCVPCGGGVERRFQSPESPHGFLLIHQRSIFAGWTHMPSVDFSTCRECKVRAHDASSRIPQAAPAVLLQFRSLYVCVCPLRGWVHAHVQVFFHGTLLCCPVLLLVKGVSEIQNWEGNVRLHTCAVRATVRWVCVWRVSEVATLRLISPTWPLTFQPTFIAMRGVPRVRVVWSVVSSSALQLVPPWSSSCCLVNVWQIKGDMWRNVGCRSHCDVHSLVLPSTSQLPCQRNTG